MQKTSNLALDQQPKINEEQHKQESNKNLSSELTILQNQQNQLLPKQQFKVGLAKFKERFSLKKNKQIIDKRKQSIFQADNWLIGTSYYREQWNQLFPHIQQTNCKAIVVQFDQCPTILLDFSKPRFPRLKQLTLVFIGISNIEALNFIDAPVLTTLNLQGNFIAKTGTLNKLLFRELQNLNLSKNYFSQVEGSRLKSYSDRLVLDFMVHERDRQIQSIGLYAKLQKKILSESMKGMFNSFSGVKRSYAIVQKKTVRCLRRKFIEESHFQA